MLFIRLASQQDADVLFDWRNDVLSRKMSRNTHEITREEHDAWLTAALLDSHREIYIAEMDGYPAGMVRVDYKEGGGVCELSWIVASEYRGMGIGKEMVRTVADSLKAMLFAEIRPENAASLRIAEYACVKVNILENEADS